MISIWLPKSTNHAVTSYCQLYVKLKISSNKGDGINSKQPTKVLEERAIFFFASIWSKMYKGMSRSRSFSEKMGGAVAPLAIGTRGTVGSLVMKEIEYFTNLELERHGSSHTISGNALRRSDSKGSFWLLSLTWKWKKRKSNNGILPNISSAVEFSKSNRFNGIPGFGYRILKDDFPI